MLLGLSEVTAGLGSSESELKTYFTEVIATLPLSLSCSRPGEKVDRFDELIATWRGEIQDVEYIKCSKNLQNCLSLLLVSF